MSIRSNQIAALYLAMLDQHTINQLAAIDQKYAAYVSKLSPDSIRSTRDQLEADLNHYLLDEVNRKLFVAIQAIIDFNKYAEEKNFILFTEAMKTAKAEELLAEHERMLIEKHEKEMAWLRAYELNKKESLIRIEELEKRVKSLLEKIKAEIEELRNEIRMLEERRDFLVNRIEANTQELREVMTQAYRGYAENSEGRELLIGDHRIVYSGEKIDETLIIRLETILRDNNVSVDSINQIERGVISDYLYNNVPQYLHGTHRSAIEQEIDKELSYLQNIKYSDNNFTRGQYLIQEIIADTKEKEAIEVEIVLKKVTLSAKEQEQKEVKSLQHDIIAIDQKKEIPKLVLLNITQQVIAAEETRYSIYASEILEPGVEDSEKLESEISNKQDDVGLEDLFDDIEDVDDANNQSDDNNPAPPGGIDANSASTVNVIQLPIDLPKPDAPLNPNSILASAPLESDLPNNNQPFIAEQNMPIPSAPPAENESANNDKPLPNGHDKSNQPPGGASISDEFHPAEKKSPNNQKGISTADMSKLMGNGKKDPSSELKSDAKSSLSESMDNDAKVTKSDIQPEVQKDNISDEPDENYSSSPRFKR